MKNPIPKIISIYLPQFHRVVENDEWWGEGYTEWTAVKSAKSLFQGHVQPRKPLNGNYYDLLDRKTLGWQASLMHKYGLSGMCFYHYYFAKGRKILEKPAENLLQWKDIDMPFCFSWANESWVRTWSKFSEDRNTWNDLIEKDKEEDENDGVLLLQDYGKEDDWKEHFLYLLPFFMDNRYIKVEGKPVFVFYRANSISCLPQMITCWQKLAYDSGLPGLYLISTNSKDDLCDAELLLEPGYTVNRVLVNSYNTNIARYGDYSDVVEKCLRAPISKDRKVYRGVFSGYDDTPRRGSGGLVIHGATPNVFEAYLRETLAESRLRGSEYVFINAWNEWGEGMYLEPDEQYGYGFLEAVKRAVETIKDASGVCGSVAAERNDSDDYIRKLEQYGSFWRVFDKWMTLKERNKPLIEYFDSHEFQKIAIYGLGMLGRHLLEEIPSERISYGIDGKAESVHMDFPVFYPSDDLPEADVIVVTPVYDFGVIYRALADHIDTKIISIENIIDEMHNELFIQ